MNLQNCGKSTGQFTNWSKIESGIHSGRRHPLLLFLLCLNQGFQVSDDEIHMDLASFRSLYANNGGSVE